MPASNLSKRIRARLLALGCNGRAASRTASLLADADGQPDIRRINNLSRDLADGMTCQAFIWFCRQPLPEEARNPFIEAFIEKLVPGLREPLNWPILFASLRESSVPAGSKFTDLEQKHGSLLPVLPAGVRQDIAASYRLRALIEALQTPKKNQNLKGMAGWLAKESAKQAKTLLKLPLPSLDEISDPNGALLVSAHHCLLGQVKTSAIEGLPSATAFARGDLEPDMSSKRMLADMLANVRAGYFGLLTPDGNIGRYTHSIQVLGLSLPVSDGFIRIAWKTRCRAIYGMGTVDEATGGLRYQLYELPRRDDGYDELRSFTEAMLGELKFVIEDVILRYPLAAGLPYKLGQTLEEAKNMPAAVSNAA